MNKLDDKMVEELLNRALDQQPEQNLSAEFTQQVLNKVAARGQMKSKIKLYGWAASFAFIILGIAVLILKEILGADVYEVLNALITQKFNIAFVVLVFLGIQFMDCRVKSRRQLMTY